MNKRWWLGFIFILCLATGLRFWHLGSIPVSVYWDEMAMMVDVKSILATGHDMFGRVWWQVIYPSYGDFKLPVYIWFATAAAKLFGLSEWSFRLPSALAGIATVIAAGGIAGELWNEKAKKSHREGKLLQHITMVIVTLAPWSIMFSRTGFEGHLGQFWFAISIWFLLRSRYPGKKWLMWISPLFGALGVYTYFSVRFVWPVVFGATWLWILWQQRETLKGNLVERGKFLLVRGAPALFQMLLFGLLMIPMLRSPIYHDLQNIRFGTDSILNEEPFALQSNIYRELAGNTRLDRIIFHRRVLQVKALAQNYSAFLTPQFLFLSGDPNLRHGTGQHGVFLWIFLPFFIVGLGSLLARRRDILLLLGLWWLVALLPAAVPLSVPHALRSLNALVPLSIIIAVGMLEAITYLLSLRPRWLGRGGLGAIVIAVVITAGQFWYVYTTLYPQRSADAWQAGYKPIAVAIANHLHSGEKVYVLPFDDRFYLWVMAYGQFSGSEFETWQSRQYRFEEAIPELTIRDPDPKLLADHGVWVAGKSDRFSQWVNQLQQLGQVNVTSMQTVPDEVGQPTFVIANVSLQMKKVKP